MGSLKKVLMGFLFISSSLFAFDLGSKFDQMADNLSNKMFDKAVDGVDSAMSDKPKQASRSAASSTTTSKKSKMEQIKELIDMKKQGYITEQEFKEQKKIILSQR